MNRILKTTIYTLFLLLSVFGVTAQNSRFILETLVTEDGRKLSNASVTVYKNGSKVETFKTDSKGQVDVFLDMGANYTVNISSMGMITKKLNIDTRNVPPEDLGSDFPFPAEVDIFQKVPDLDVSILDQPIGIIRYNPSISNFDVDLEHTKRVKSKLEQLQKEYEEKKAAEAANAANAQKIYDEAIKKADKFFDNEQWKEAKAEYEIAAKAIPFETYPSFQIAELQSKLIKQEQADSKYNAAMESAKKAFVSKDYQRSIADYKIAQSLKPEESEPAAKIKEIEGFLANQAKTEQAYLEAINKGDKALITNNLDEAKTAFEEASRLKPEESYPKNKLAEINDVMQKAAAKDKAYADAITNGEQAIKEGDLVAAKGAFTKAQGIKPKETLPQEKLEQIEALMAEQAKKEQSYLAAIQKGEDALASKSFEDAKKAFQEASGIKPSEEYPKNKIKEIDDFIAKNAAKEQAYKDAIAAGDKALSSGDYAVAKTSFEEANGIKPKETYPTQKIAEIEAILAENAKKDQAYSAAVAAGDQALAASNYEAAKTEFQKAGELKPDEKYPKDKLSEIEAIIAEQNKKNEAYQKAISEGDDLLANQQYEAAKTAFQTAIELKASEEYPKGKLKEIDGLLAQAAEQEKAYKEAIASADAALAKENLEAAKKGYEAAINLKASEQYPKDKLKEVNDLLAQAAKKEQEYTETIAKADQAFDAKKLVEAKAAYEAALALKPGEVYPESKLKEIASLQEEQAKQEAAYQEAIAKADATFSSGAFEEAKNDYEAALKLKPAEQYPKDQIAAAESKILEKQKELEEIRIAKEKEEAAAKAYADLIAKADKQLIDKKYVDAITNYEAAIAIKSDDQYPTEKIAEAQAAIAAIEEAEKAYTAMLKKGDDALALGAYEDAKKAYESALKLKPSEQYPKDQIAEANRLAADAEAAAQAKAEEEKKEAAYQAELKTADGQLANKAFEDAIATYQKALSIKPNEQYPKDKITEAEELLAAALGEKAAAEKAAKVEAEYQAIIAKADASLEAKSYEKAKSAYQDAKSIKPNETYPDEKIVEITNLLNAQAAAEEKAKIEAAYQAKIAEADQALVNKNYEDAIAQFNAALEIKPEESYPKSKVNEIKALLGEQAAKEAAANAAAEMEANYQALIKSADDAFNNEKWEKAKKDYNAALAIKEESYPKNQVELANAKLKELADAAEEIRLANEKENQLEQAYQEQIAIANNLFVDEDFEGAIAVYKKSLTIKPNDEYANEQIRKAEYRISERLKAEEERLAAEKNSYEIKAKYLNIIAKADQFYALEEFDQAVEKYNEALAVKDEQYPKDQIQLIASQKERKEAEAVEQAKLNEAYAAAIKEAIAAFDTKQYETALSAFESASELKPFESLPKERIKEISSLLAAKEAERDKAMAEKKRAEENRLAYESLIRSADNAYDNGDYQAAKGDYTGALKIKPNEAYPQDKLKQVQAKIDAEKRAKEAAALALAEKERQEQREKEKIVVKGKSEAEIEAMYKEMWANKSSKKAEAKKTEAQMLADRKAKEVEQDEADRQVALQRLKNISVSIEENKPVGSDRYLQNLAAVNQQAEAIDKVEEGRIITAQRSREEKMMDLNDLQANIDDTKDGYTYRTLTPNYEKVKQMADAKESQTASLTREQQERITATRAQLVEIDQKIQSYRAQLAKARLEKTATNPSDQAKAITDKQLATQKEADQIIATNQQKINELMKQKAEVQEKYNEDISQKGMEFSQNAAAYQQAIEDEAQARNTAKASINSDAYYTGEKRKRNDADLANKYPQGVTEEIIDGDRNSTTIRRIVVEGTQVDIYEKTFYSWGAIFYNKNGVNIDEETWKREAKK